MKQKGFAPIIILVLIALAVVGYFGYKNYRPKLQTLITPIPTASQAPNGDLANWKTYTDKDGEFTFKYPNDWGVLDLGGPLMIAPSSDIENVRKMKKDDNFEGGKFLISLLTVYNDVYNHEVVSDEYTKVSKTSIQIDNKIADRYESVYLKDTPNGEYVKGDMGITVIIPLKSRLLIEYLLADQKYSKIFDQILSTFQFTQ